MKSLMVSDPVLVTGATGYVGGRLVSRLLEAGYRVRAMGRSRRKLSGRSWSGHPNLEFAKADLLDDDISPLKEALKGCFVAYYLVHSMDPKHKDFAGADRKAAGHFIRAADKSDLKRIIYLGGLGKESADLSSHLKSRAEVGRILKSGNVPVTIFRSGIILGSGSASFEMLRYLAERMPFMIISPQVLDSEVQPICIRNVLNYLVTCLEKEETVGEVFDIGGPDILSFRELFELYANETGTRRPFFLTSSFIPLSDLVRRIGIAIAKLVLPISPAISEPLLQGAGNQIVVMDDRITRIIPQELVSCREAIRRAIEKDSLQMVETRWTDAGELKPPEWAHLGDARYAGGTLLQGGFRVIMKASPKDIWPFIGRIGGKNGWYYGDFLWQVRGWMDSIAGGVGLRRGRRHPEQLFAGDALDFWRVLKVNPPFSLILFAEMKLPGEAVLEFALIPEKSENTEIRLHTMFRPKGLYGLFYWYILLPFHDLLFGGMLKAIAGRVGRPIIKGPNKFRA